MFSLSLLSAAALVATTAAQSYPLTQVYQFENAFSGVGYVNIENIALRKSNGQLLLNTVTGAIMAQLDPANPSPEVLVNITGALGNGQPGSLVGIAETYPDVYTVAAGNFQFGPQVPGGVIGIPGSFSVWSVDLNGPKAQVNQIASIPEAASLNGVAAIPHGNRDLVLIADSQLGAVWAVNVKTSEYKIVIQSDLFLPSAENNFGINGIKVRGHNLYFTNSAQQIFGAVAINPWTGQALGAVEQLVMGPNTTAFDDFAFKQTTGSAWVAGQPNAVYEITQAKAVNLVAGGDDSSPLLGPTATAFGADGCTLYITTGGVGGGPMGPQSGQVFALDTCSQAAPAPAGPPAGFPAGAEAGKQAGGWQKWAA